MQNMISTTSMVSYWRPIGVAWRKVKQGLQWRSSWVI